jgi:NAD(P)-dependent dehydrogenase (short-subunit alcohol dehydrogenase family)
VADHLKSKTYLITGSTGIAAATARLAARLPGARVFFTSLTAEPGRALEEELRGAGGECGFHVADLTDSRAAAEAVRSCVARFGRVDALFNVVGISGRRLGDGPVHECTEEGWDATMAANVKTMFLMSREVIRQMLAQEVSDGGLRGAVLNMASVLALAPEREHFATHAYAASKGAVVSLTQAMAAYYAPHKIRVNAVAPGLVRTPMSARAQQNEAILELMKTKQPLAEDLIEAEDVARAALFLLGDESRFVTGEVLTVDAGWRMS